MTQNRSIPAPSTPQPARSDQETGGPRPAAPLAVRFRAAAPPAPAADRPPAGAADAARFTATAAPEPVRPGGLLLTDACRPAIRRALTAHPRLLLVGCASGPSGGRAIELA